MQVSSVFICDEILNSSHLLHEVTPLCDLQNDRMTRGNFHAAGIDLLQLASVLVLQEEVEVSTGGNDDM